MPIRASALLVILAAALSPGSDARGQVEEPEELAPGLVLDFDHPRSPSIVARRISPTPAWDFATGSPDSRIPVDGFRLKARGLILIQSPGLHRFFVRTDGETEVRIGEQSVARGRGNVDGQGLDLRAGFVPFSVVYTHGSGASRLAIDWQGPGFAREPIPGRILFHEPGPASSVDDFEQGRRLADRLGCANCHDLPGLRPHPSLGPPLKGAVAYLDAGWLNHWLGDPTKVRPDTTMPAYGQGLSETEVADLTAFLAGLGPKTPNLSGEVRMALNVASADKGRVLFRSLGCLGCHANQEGVLSDLARKRSPAQLAAFLEHARNSKVPSRHRPDLRLSSDESSHLAAYLLETPMPPLNGKGPTGNAKQGQDLAKKLRCNACHDLGSGPEKVGRLSIATTGNEPRGCLAETVERNGVPRFALDADQRRVLQAFVNGRAAKPALPAPNEVAHDVIRRRNCLGCHARDGEGGAELAGRLAPWLGVDSALGALKGTLTPPNLTAVGDKLRPEYLLQAIRGQAPTARPWLSARMPVFEFDRGEAEGIAARFHSVDRMQSERDPTNDPAPVPHPQDEIAARLLGQRGFGCLSCHVVAGRIPAGGEPETLGPDLALAHLRMTERYFRRWISDPQRVIAGTPMPQFLKPVAGEGLPATLDEQVRAVWKLLSRPDLSQTVAFGTREILKPQGNRPAVVRDMVLLPDAPDTPYTPRGIAIGLKNGSSLLFDADRLTWLSWWRGGFLSRTKSGRLWEWHPEGQRTWVIPSRRPPLVFLKQGGGIATPVETRERFGTFRTLEFTGEGVRLMYALDLGSGRLAEVSESVVPVPDGFERRVEVEGVPEALKPAIVEFPKPPIGSDASGAEFAWTEGATEVRVTVEAGRPLEPMSSPGYATARLWELRSRGEGRYEGSLRVVYRVAESGSRK